MPTGYTADIENDISFDDFLLGCARAFGACLHQRDDNTKIKPQLREVSTYHEDKLLETEAELGAFLTMNREQKEAVGQELKDEAINSTQEYLNSKITLKGKYETMLVKAQAWNPPTPDHNNLKQFMIDQINESINFDCNLKYSIEELSKYSNMSALDFYNDKVEKLQWSVKYHTEENEKEIQRVEEANRWISALYDSMGIKY